MRIGGYLLSVGAAALMAASAMADELRIGVRAGGESMDPHFSAVGSNIAAIRNVFDALVGLGAQLQPVPGLAESWEVIDDTTWRFHLRPGVTFHDGSGFGAEDVVASFARIPAAAGPDGRLATYVRRIVEIVAVDALTVDVITNAPAATLPLDLTNPELDPIIREAAATLDDDTRRALIKGGIRMARDEMAAIPIVNLNVAWAGRSGAYAFTPRMDQETLAVNFDPLDRAGAGRSE